jgi:hypothetical protein
VPASNRTRHEWPKVPASNRTRHEFDSSGKFFSRLPPRDAGDQQFSIAKRRGLLGVLSWCSVLVFCLGVLSSIRIGNS